MLDNYIILRLDNKDIAMRKGLFVFGLMILVVMLFSGCFGDSFYFDKGLVLDKESNKPIGGVKIGLSKDAEQNSYSNEKGEYDFHGGGVSGDFELYFSKVGYKTLKVEFDDTHIRNKHNDTIYLEKLKN